MLFYEDAYAEDDLTSSSEDDDYTDEGSFNSDDDSENNMEYINDQLIGQSERSIAVKSTKNINFKKLRSGIIDEIRLKNNSINEKIDETESYRESTWLSHIKGSESNATS